MPDVNERIIAAKLPSNAEVQFENSRNSWQIIIHSLTTSEAIRVAEVVKKELEK